MSEKVVNTGSLEPKTDQKAEGLAARIKKKALKKIGGEDTVLVWPNLVYLELISMLFALAILLFLCLYSPAPLEELASADTTPNPTKAPWYFLGLQELLVFFDPWLAGFVLPNLIMIGLILIPYIDPNPKGKGYYTFSERKFAVIGFSFGRVWLRGLDWSWYWPWDDPHMHQPAGDVKLVDLQVILQSSLGLSENPVVTLGRYVVTVANLITWALFFGYYAVGFAVPFLFLRKFYNELGFVRYNLTMFLFLSMMGVPLKMFLRLLADIKYVVVTPWFNI